ncbi:MAG: aminotransferase class I/II-fold pyridoxal phosphate-dependent enzyme [Salaquimonas sp.]
MSKSIHLSQRGIVEPFRAMEVVAKAAEMQKAGEDIVMMCVGQPSAPAPMAARQAAMDAIAKGRIGYTPAKGIEPLRRRISKHYADRYKVDVDPDRIVVTTGSSAGFMLAFIALFDESDRVAIPSPGYPAYRNILKALSLKPVEIASTPASRWVLTPEMLEHAHREQPLHGVLIANPNNPNGTMLLPETFEALICKSQELGISFISDEIYHGLTYGVAEETALKYSQDAIIINSFSKYFCMTGWRVGWMIVPETMVDTVNRLQQNAFICAPEVSQIAALHAFDGMEELEIVKRGYLENRKFLLEALPALGFKEIQPVDGAFYIYANISTLSNDSEAFCAELLEHAKTAITPGTDFDSARGNAWVRISFAGSLDDMKSGIERVGKYLQQR